MRETYLCFQPDHGFCVYQFRPGSKPFAPQVSYTMDPASAHEASIDQWEAAMREAGISDYRLILSGPYASDLQSHAKTVSPAYVDSAVAQIREAADLCMHFPYQAQVRLKAICRALEHRSPLPFIKDEPETV